MQIILFGASGFIGRNLVQRWRDEDKTVIAVNQTGQPVEGAAQTFSIDQLRDLNLDPSKTIAVHVAAYRYDSSRFELKQSDIFVQNVVLNNKIYQFCAERGLAELRMASSVAVYPAHLPIMDDADPIDLNAAPHAGEGFYAWSKRTAEIMSYWYEKQYGLHTIGFRFSNPYGPFDSVDPNRAHVAPAFVMKALDDNPVFPIRGDPAVERDFVYVGDVVEAFSRSLAERGRTDYYNLCSGGTTTLLDLAQRIMKVAQVEKPIESGVPGAFGPAIRKSTNLRIVKDFGMEFSSLEVGMAPTIAWYRENFRV
jgi:nucleoside-diphosphate-sugar epimerase